MSKYQIKKIENKNKSTISIMALFLVSFVAISLIIITSQSVLAIPNPASAYCVEQGYTLENGLCIFPDGNSCGQWDFYQDECGEEYKKEIPCKKEGEELTPGSQCCEGLIGIGRSVPASDSETIGDLSSASDICISIIGGWSICAPCGDGICDSVLENRCNCPEDCEVKCKKEGESIPVIANPPECCEGLTLIPPPYPNLVGSMGICTAKCGNGVCDSKTETRYNCPEDCPCTGEGERISGIGQECCSGLKQIDDCRETDRGECLCVEVLGGATGYCTNCGDNICKSPENRCNCSEDCKVVVVSTETEEITEAIPETPSTQPPVTKTKEEEPSPPTPGIETSVGNLKAQIAELQQKIVQLTSQLNTMLKVQGKPEVSVPGFEKPTALVIPSDHSFVRPLYIGQKNNDVKYLQEFLKKQESDIYPEGLVTGYYGPLTKAAVTRFQLKHGVVDSESSWGAGYMGPKTRTRINEALK